MLSEDETVLTHKSCMRFAAGNVKHTYYIQTLEDFKPEITGTVRSVGITAGASTPNQIIEEVHTNVRIKF